MDKQSSSRTLFHYQWKKEKNLAAAFASGVSLHGHTWNSHEGLLFLPMAARKTRVFLRSLRKMEEGYAKKWGEKFDYRKGYWTTPVSPDAAYALESKQIAGLGLAPIVSITDHDEIVACEGRGVISLEWTAPYHRAVFHIGIHNLPGPHARRIWEKLREATHHPDDAGMLRACLEEIVSFPDTLVVLNHPLIDQGRIGHAMHISAVDDFLSNHGGLVHALEINAMQSWRVNKKVVAIADRYDLPLISGGDRHSFEPNAVINLTAAKDFAGFAREIREEKKSDIMIMSHFRQSLTLRYLRNAQVIMADYPELGARRHWYDRVFYQCPDGVVRSVAEMTGERGKLVRTTNRIARVVRATADVSQPFSPIFTRLKRRRMAANRYGRSRERA